MDEPDRSLIIIPEKYRQAAHIGTVIACGPGRWVKGINGGMVRARMDVKPEMLVAFGRFTDWDVDGCVLIQEADVMFILKEPAKIGIDAFVHNAVGVEHVAGSLEARFD